MEICDFRIGKIAKVFIAIIINKPMTSNAFGPKERITCIELYDI